MLIISHTIPTSKVKEFNSKLRDYLKTNASNFLTEIVEKKKLETDNEEVLIDAITKVREAFV